MPILKPCKGIVEGRSHSYIKNTIKAPQRGSQQNIGLLQRAIKISIRRMPILKPCKGIVEGRSHSYIKNTIKAPQRGLKWF